MPVESPAIAPGAEAPARDALSEVGSAPSAGGGPPSDSITAGAGALSALLGAAVLVGWHGNFPSLLRIYPGLTPMSYNSAISFLAVGIAFGAIAFRWDGAARLFAGIAAVIALVRLFHSLTGWPEQFETAISRFTLPHSSVAVVAMAPNTGAGFVLIALAVFVGSSRREFRGKAAALALCGAGSAALGLNSLIGYLTGVQTYLWANFNPMAVHTAAGLILLGVAILASSWREHRRATDWFSWASVATAAFGVITSLSFWQALSSLDRLPLESAVRFRSALPELVLIFGLLVTALLLVAVSLAETARGRTALAEQSRAETETASRSLAFSERKYRTLIETLSQKIAHKDRQSVYLSCNQSYARDLKIAPAAIAGKTDYDFYPAELAEKYRADDRRVMESGEIAEIEEDYLVQGRKVWVQTVKTPVRDERGAVIGVIVIFWDITDRKRAESELQRASAYHRTLLEASLDPLVTIAPDGKITDVNRAAERATGCPRQELIGTDFCDYFADPGKARLGYQQAFREAVENYELQLQHRDGHVTPVLYNASVYRDDNGAVSGVFAAARDITERKRAEEALERKAEELARSNADLEQFAYVASHDLQEPLRMVANFTQLLADRYRDKLGPEGVEFVGYAVDGATRMQRLIQDLLTYSRVGTRGAGIQATDCHEALGAAVANLQLVIQESGAVITHSELPRVMADPSQLVQVFQNLLGNAVKFRSQAPLVHVSAERRGSQWILAVRDNGIGIDPAFGSRIFVIFQRLHSRAEYPGTGIGLALCKKIVERHGGKIWVESEPGRGATFFFALPAAEEK